MDGSGWRPGGGLVGSPGAVGTAGTWPSRAGPHFSGEMGERAPRGFAPWTPVGERVSFPHTPFLWTVVEAAWVFCRPTWPAASKTNASWPAHQLGRAGEVVYCREEKWKPERLLSAFSQRAPAHAPSPPSRWTGRYQRSNERAAGQVTSEKYSLPLHNPTREGGPGGGTSSPGGSFPHFFPRNGAPAGQAKVPCRSNGVRERPQWHPTQAAPVPARSNGAGKNQGGRQPFSSLPA